MLTVGCVVYGVAVWLFALAILLASYVHRGAMRLQAEARNQDEQSNRTRQPMTPELRVLIRRFFTLLGVGLFLFLVAVSIEIYGIGFGLFGGQTSCPGFWPDPRSLRNL